MGETYVLQVSPILSLFSPCLFPKKTVFPKHTPRHASSVLKFHLWRPIAYGIKARPFIICMLPGFPGPPGLARLRRVSPWPSRLQAVPPGERTRCHVSLECRAVPAPCALFKSPGSPPCVLFYSSVPTSCNYLFPAPCLPPSHPGSNSRHLALANLLNRCWK